VSGTPLAEADRAAGRLPALAVKGGTAAIESVFRCASSRPGVMSSGSRSANLNQDRGPMSSGATCAAPVYGRRFQDAGVDLVKGAATMIAPTTSDAFGEPHQETLRAHEPRAGSENRLDGIDTSGRIAPEGKRVEIFARMTRRQEVTPGALGRTIALEGRRAGHERRSAQVRS